EDEPREEAEGRESDSEGGSDEMVGVRKVVLLHKLFTRSASCFCSACRVRHYDECYINATYPRLVPTLKEGTVEERVVMDTGVDPKTVDPDTGLYNG
ncbi:unnamed protein product, partial [Pylaiella littoralis]